MSVMEKLKMKTRSHLSIFTMAVIFIALLLLAACQPTTVHQASTNNSDVERWAAMGEYYDILSGKRPVSGEAADQTRWEAMGDFYLVYTGGRPLSASQADQARWTGNGEFYSKSGVISVLSKSIQ